MHIMGLLAFCLTLSIDFDGDPRPSGVTCDIGADEFVP